MERKFQKPHLAGYLPPARLSEVCRDALRATEREKRIIVGRQLIREVAGWCALTDEEAIGLLESAKFEFMVSAESGGHSLKKLKK